jgi:hypothetical protein
MHEQRQEHPLSWRLHSQAFRAASFIPIGQHCHAETWIGRSRTADSTVAEESAFARGARGESATALPNESSTVTISAKTTAATPRRVRAFLIEDENAAASSSAASAEAFAPIR